MVFRDYRSYLKCEDRVEPIGVKCTLITDDITRHIKT